eukprot:600538-Rhodomonas_salina.1
MVRSPRSGQRGNLGTYSGLNERLRAGIHLPIRVVTRSANGHQRGSLTCGTRPGQAGRCASEQSSSVLSVMNSWERQS